MLTSKIRALSMFMPLFPSSTPELLNSRTETSQHSQTTTGSPKPPSGTFHNPKASKGPLRMFKGSETCLEDESATFV